ncbi:CNNM domain-containing protein, partial [Candidatus Omnitrophota bacterium]
MSVIFLLFISLLFLSAVFSASETALFSLSSIERKRIASAVDWRSNILHGLMTHPSKTLGTILIGNMLVNTALTCLFTLYALSHYPHEWFGAQLIIFTFILLIGGEVVPKNLALAWNVRLAYLLSIPLLIFSFIFYPFLKILMFFTNMFTKTISKARNIKDDFSGDEIKTLIEISREAGVIAEEEVERLSNIFSFGERKVKEIMIPRTDMISYDIDNGREGLLELVRETRCRYVVVYKNTIDTIRGIVFTKHLLLH